MQCTMQCAQWRHIFVLCATVLATTLTGCGSGVDLVKVSGTATCQGKPVPDLMVVFVPEKGRISSGTTDAEGRFVLKFTREEEGVIPGEHRVHVAYAPTDAEVRMAIEQGKAKLPREISKILAKYGDPAKSPLVFEIRKSEEIALKLD